jgi:para-aminobenzoate synthetase
MLLVESACGAVNSMGTRLFDYLDAELRANRVAVSEENAAALPFDFWGGYVGYFGYEMKVGAGCLQVGMAS